VSATSLTVTQKPATSPTNELEEWSGATDDTDVIVLHRFFDKHADKIGKELLSLSKPSPEGDMTAVNGKRAWDGLCALLVDLGTPLEVPKPSPMQSTEHSEYLELMDDFAGRNVSRVRDLFVEIEVPVVCSAILFECKTGTDTHSVEPTFRLRIQTLPNRRGRS
jgi:neurofibromin 1